MTILASAIRLGRLIRHISGSAPQTPRVYQLPLEGSRLTSSIFDNCGEEPKLAQTFMPPPLAGPRGAALTLSVKFGH